MHLLLPLFLARSLRRHRIITLGTQLYLGIYLHTTQPHGIGLCSKKTIRISGGLYSRSGINNPSAGVTCSLPRQRTLKQLPSSLLSVVCQSSFSGFCYFISTEDLPLITWFTAAWCKTIDSGVTVDQSQGHGVVQCISGILLMLAWKVCRNLFRKIPDHIL